MNRRMTAGSRPGGWYPTDTVRNRTRAVPYPHAMTTPVPLEVSSHRRAVRIALWVALALAVAVIVAWYTARPPALPTTDAAPRTSTPVDVPVYVGMFTAPADFGRTLSVDGIKVHVTANTDVDVVPLLCKGGSVVATSDTEAFCQELLDPEGRRLGAGDSVVLEVVADEPAIVVVDRIRIGYQDGVRAATQDAGADHAVVQVLGR